MSSKYISTNLIAGIVFGLYSSANAQITSSGKKLQFTRTGQIDHISEEAKTRVQARLEYKKRGEDVSFLKGSVIVGIFYTGVGFTTSEPTVDIQVSESDVFLWIKMLDELYTTPLGDNENLKLHLKPKNVNSGALLYVGDTLTIHKVAGGYIIWNPGYSRYDKFGNRFIFEDEWTNIDLVVFRETLAAVARAAMPDKPIPEPPTQMNSQLEKAHAHIWEPGKK